MHHPTDHHDHHTDHSPQGGRKERSTAVLDVSGLQWASEQNVVVSRLGRRPGVLRVEVNPVSQTATVVFDPGRTSLAELRGWVEECGYHCAGQSVPSHLCDPMTEPDPPGAPPPAPTDHAAHEHGGPAHHDGHHGHEGHTGTAVLPPPDEHPAHAGRTEHAGHAAHAEHGEPEGMPSPHEVMGHGGHGGMSMAAMVADMRNRFLVAVLFSIPIVIWSPIGKDVFGLDVPVPFGLRQDVWALLLSLPVIFYSCTIFFDGAVRALRARTLDMMVLVAVAVGSGWTYSLIVTLTGGGDVFYEAATVLASFVLLGHFCSRSASANTGATCSSLGVVCRRRASAVARSRSRRASW
jgi:Cu2+-exporting ATPase